MALAPATRDSLAELIREATRVKLPEPFLSDVLIASGINAPLLHSPTYSLPEVDPLQSAEELEPPARSAEQRRLVDAYDVLSYLELTLREFIGRKLRELHGDGWWKMGLPQQIRERCEERKREKEAPAMLSHHPIAYAYVDDLRAIIQKRDNRNQLFASIFGNRTELETCFMWVGRARVDIAHPRPLSDDDYMYFTTGAHWIHSAMAQTMNPNEAET